MAPLLINRLSKLQQYALSAGVIILVAGICFVFVEALHYKLVAFLLMLVVSLIAILFDIFPVLLAAVLSALIWNLFFIPPRYTLYIAETEDRILFLVYFLIALVNAALTYKIKRIQKENREKEDKANALRLYNTLLNSLSHELKTPIATIIGATDNLQHFSNKLSATDRFELVHEISTAGFRLNRQVENLLNMSRLESGVIQPKKDWCDIEELLYDVLKSFEEKSPGRQIHIHVNPSIPLFKIDRGMMEQVLYNLVHNAIQYTDERGRIDLEAVAHADMLQIMVSDNGPGFPLNEMDKVFDKFYRLQHSRPGGTGLGLSIVKGFVEAQDGNVFLENRAEGGSKFTILIKAETSYLNQLKNE